MASNNSSTSAVDIPSSRLSSRILRHPTLPLEEEDSKPSIIHRNSDSISQDSVLKNGWLYYKRGLPKTWKRYWIVLRNHQLTWYKDEKEYKPKEVISTADIMSASMITDHTKEKGHFEVYTASHTHHFRADNDPDAHDWVDVIKYTADEVAESLLSSSFKRMDSLSLSTVGQQQQRLEENCEMILNSPQGIVFPHNFNNQPGSAGTALSPKSASYFEFSGTEGVSSAPSKEDERFQEQQSLSDLPKNSQQQRPKTDMAVASTSDDEKIIKKGYMLRLKKRLNLWKRQYVVLTTQRVIFAKSETQLEHPLKVISISSIADVVDIDPLSKTKIYCMQIITPEKRFRFCLDSEEALTSWLASLKSIVRRGSGSNHLQQSKATGVPQQTGTKAETHNLVNQDQQHREPDMTVSISPATSPSLSSGVDSSQLLQVS